MTVASRTIFDTVRLLSQPGAYDPPPASVRVRQTHGSFVFLAGGFAYKMKRPVKYAFVDFSTLEKRRAALERELRLNRRLAPEVYLDVLPVLARGEGLRVGRPGEEAGAVEFLLRMKELPAESFLAALLAREGAREGGGAPLLARVAEAAAAFHLGAERGEGAAEHGAPGAVRRRRSGALHGSENSSDAVFSWGGARPGTVWSSRDILAFIAARRRE